MPIVYYLDQPCEVKEQISPGRMLRLLYAHERANEAVNRVRRVSKKEAVDSAGQNYGDTEVQLSIKDKSGKLQPKLTTVGAIRKQYSELERYSSHCDDCQARIVTRSFGCRSVIDYPISLKAEAFIMGFIHESGGDPTSSMLLNYIENNGITGNRANEMRKLPKVFFESDKPLVRRLIDGRKLTSDHVFELLFQHEKINPTHARFLLGMLDLYIDSLPFDRELSQLKELFVFEKKDSGMVVARSGLKLVARPSDDQSIRHIQNFFGALLLAHEFKSDIWVKG